MSGDIRCPYCNGTALLPTERIAAIERDRDEFALRKEIASRIWGELSDLVVEAGKKKATLESIRSQLRSSHRSMGKWMTLDRIVGR